MAKFRALTTIDHDNKRYLEGEEMEISGDAAAQLEALGRVEPVGRKRRSERGAEGGGAPEGNGGAGDGKSEG